MQNSPELLRVLGQIGQREGVVGRVDKVEIFLVLLVALGVEVHLELLPGPGHQVHIFRSTRDAPFELFAYMLFRAINIAGPGDDVAGCRFVCGEEIGKKEHGKSTSDISFEGL